MDNPVQLRAVTEADLDAIEGWRHDADHQSEFGNFMSMQRRNGKLRQDWLDGGLLSKDGGMLVVVAAGDPVGDVQWHPVHYGPNAGSQALNIGIALAPQARGRGFGSAAQALLAEYLFAHTTVNRVEASTDVENLAEQRALEKAGFTREGVLRGAQYRQGEWHDMVSYGMVRSDLQRR